MLNQLVDCPLPEEVAASAVYGTLHRCEDYSVEGDHNPCDSSARDADDWSILVGLSANAAIEDSESATICYDQEWRDEMEGQTNPGWLYRFAYAAEVLQPGMQIQVWQVDLAGCHGSPRVVELDENGTATLALSASIYCD